MSAVFFGGYVGRLGAGNQEGRKERRNSSENKKAQGQTAFPMDECRSRLGPGYRRRGRDLKRAGNRLSSATALVYYE